MAINYKTHPKGTKLFIRHEGAIVQVSVKDYVCVLERVSNHGYCTDYMILLDSKLGELEVGKDRCFFESVDDAIIGNYIKGDTVKIESVIASLGFATGGDIARIWIIKADGTVTSVDKLIKSASFYGSRPLELADNWSDNTFSGEYFRTKEDALIEARKRTKVIML